MNETLVIVEKSQIIDLADTIRTKTGKTEAMSISEINQAAKTIKTEISLQDKIITRNGTYSSDEEYDGLNNVIVNVLSGEADESVVKVSTGHGKGLNLTIVDTTSAVLNNNSLMIGV